MKKTTITLLIAAVVMWLPTLAQPPLLDAAEYFFDTDPGFGNGTPVAVTPGTTLSSTFDLDISGLDQGVHSAYIRVRDADGNWSFVYRAVVFKVINPGSGTLSELSEMEYFFDTDPGFGNGTAVPVTAGTTLDETFTIDLSALDPGYHKVYFRVMDETDIWGHSYIHNIVRFSTVTPPSLPEIQALEYYFDNDPGFGNGTSVSVTSGYMIDETFEVDMSSLDAGYHKLYIRTMDANSDWSLACIHNLVRVVAGDPAEALNLVALEYFIDEDPGFGNGNSVAAGPEPAIDMTFEADLSAIAPGEHTLFVRALDETGSWSLITESTFVISEAELTAFLEGPFNGTDMNTTLNSAGFIPLEQPFNTPPWNYDGGESVVSMPNADVVDWILLETRNATEASAATTSTASSRFAAFILKDGSITGLDGSTNLQFNAGSVSGNFLVIYHRNHLEVLSAAQLEFTEGKFLYDFSSGADQVYGGTQVLIGTGLYGIYSGDLNGDGVIDEGDLAAEWEMEAGASGYLDSDINMDVQADNVDKNDHWLPNKGTSSAIPD